MARRTSPGNRSSSLATVVDLILLLVIAAGTVARFVAVPLYVSDSGDEWGNTIAPFRVLFEHGDPGTFFHPSLYYYVTSLAYAVVFAVSKAVGAIPPSLSMTDLFLADERCFLFAARGISAAAAPLTFYAVFCLARSLWDRRAGLLAAALLAVLPLHALYSHTVRVDSLYLLLFVCSASCLVRVIRDPTRAAYGQAGLVIGLAAGANYNGAILLLWLIAAHFLRPTGAYPREASQVIRALALAMAAFLVSSPFVLLNLNTFLQGFGFISSLAVSAHPGWEGRGVLFYVTDFAQGEPLLSALICLSSLVIAVVGSRTERFLLSLPLGYLLIFSLLPTKDERFILPAIALLLIVASGLPFSLARGLRANPPLRIASKALTYVLVVACIGIMAPESIPFSQPHLMLKRPDEAVFDWIEANVAPHSNILVESGIIPLFDTLKEPGTFAAELRKSLIAKRRNLDLNFIGVVYVGGRNYDPGMILARHIDYAIISKRHVHYIEEHCDSYPEVCAFYRELEASARLVFDSPPGVESVYVYGIQRN